MKASWMVVASLIVLAGGNPLWGAVSAAGLASQTVPETGKDVTLPAPTGNYGVGTRTWYWVDPSRFDEITEAAGDHRAVMVQLWYPREPDREQETAPYMPLYGWYRRVHVHAVADAPWAASAPPGPVLVICPGRGTARHFYTTLAEDLASHGYAVVAIDSPHTGRVVYSDRRYIGPSDRYRPSRELMQGPYEKVDAFFEEAATLGRQDVEFVLDQLRHLNATDGMLAGRLDMDNLGLFGHSLGGRIGGAAVAHDPRFRAFAAMEAVPPRAERRAGLDAAVAMMYGGTFPDAAVENVSEVIPNRRNDVLLIRFTQLGHNSVTDEPYLRPDDFDYPADPAAGLELAVRFLRSFFDRYLRGEETALTWLAESPGIAVRWSWAP